MAETSPVAFKYLVERQREEIRVINEVGRLLGSTTDSVELIRRLSVYLIHSFPVALISVLTLERRQIQVIPCAKIAQADLDAALQEVRKEAAKLDPALADAEVKTVFEDAAGAQAQLALGGLSYLRSRFSVALVSNDKPLGLLTLASGKAEAFSNEDRHVVAIIADQLSAALRNAYLVEELRKADKLKQDLLLVISHELRIPLTSIKESVSLLLENALGSLSADQRDFLGTVNENAERLNRLVEKVVTTTLLVTDKLTYTKKPVPVAELLAGIEKAFAPPATAKRVKLAVKGDTRNASVQADVDKLLQALGCVVENAIQASGEEQTVTVSATESNGRVQIQVADAGRGIPADQIPKLFTQFRGIEDVDNRKTGGLGLGLFLAKAILAAHNGTIGLTSAEGRGTTVTLALPKAATSGT